MSATTQTPASYAEPSPALPGTQTPPLTHLGVIRAAGADAASFLQGQLTQDVLTLAVGQSRLAAFCSAKGRMLASFWVLKRLGADAQPEFLLVCSRDILAQTLKRLSMFVMRAKVKMTDATGDFQLVGTVGSLDSPGLPGAESITLPAGASAAFRSLVLLPQLPGQPAVEPAGAYLALDTWHWLEVQSGVAMITLPTVEAFVPQMLNYESVGGVNFKKGCYPGQEVVARSQFRGTLKRRAYIVHGQLAMAAGDAVFSPLDAEQPCGSVVQAAAAPGGGFDAIVSIQISAAQTAALTWGSAAGEPLQLLNLPYALLEDI
jgi:folate-binding protein YgfZ